MRLAGCVGRRSSTSFRYRYGSWWLSLADWIRPMMTAARWPARSDPAKSGLALPRATGRIRFSSQSLSKGRSPLHACAKMRARSDEVPLLQTACAQPQTKVIVHKHLHAIGSAVHEEVRVMRARLAEHTHHASERRIHLRAHVQRLNGKPTPLDADHLMSSRSSNAHSRAADAGHSTLTVLEPRRTSMRIAAS
jgi:hypothetical protein